MQHGLFEIWAVMSPLGKGVVVVLLLMSVIAVGVAIERVFGLILAMSRGRRAAESFLTRIAQGELHDLPRAHAGDDSWSRVAAAGMGVYVDGRVAAPGAQALVDAVDAALARAVAFEGGELRRGLSTLATIASTAPFVGLFGTVVGIVTSFNEIARTGSGGLEAVSAGIAEALVATALGIFVAVPSVVLFNFFAGRADAAEAFLTDSAGALVEAVRRASWNTNGASEPPEQADETDES